MNRSYTSTTSCSASTPSTWGRSRRRTASPDRQRFLMETAGPDENGSSAGEDPNEHIMRRFQATTVARRSPEREASVRRARRRRVIGSGEIWNSELDRIQRFHDQYGPRWRKWKPLPPRRLPTSSTSRSWVSASLQQHHNGGTYDVRTGEACQEYVYDVVKPTSAPGRR